MNSRLGTMMIFALVLLPYMALAQDSAAQLTFSPVAKVGDDVITMDELHRALKSELEQIDQQRYKLMEEKLDQFIADKLLAREAKLRNLTVDELVKAEVYSKISAVTDQEVDRYLAENRESFSQPDDPELRLKVWNYLRALKANERRGIYINTLRGKTQVSVSLQEPSGLRVNVDAGKGFSRGPGDATIAIVEFSDFQCPFCKAAVAMVKQLLARYAVSVRWVFRDFPIAALHPLAPKAHEAARCAAEQRKFWEYHDHLFERSPRLAPTELKQYARDLNLDGKNFDECLDSGKYRSAVASDLEEGMKLGVSATPTFFINGRKLVGAQSLSPLQMVIDAELARNQGQ